MWQVKLTAAAADSLQSLREDDRGPVLQATGRLTLGPNSLGTPQSYRLPSDPDVIAFGVGRRLLMAFKVSRNGRTITIVDIVAHGRATEFAGASPPIP
jgi:hypothetical protein